jgi:hypothetical protein
MRSARLALITTVIAGLHTATAAHADTDAPEIEHARIERAALGQPITIRARITDKSAIFAPSLLVRQRGKKEFDTIELKKVGDVFQAVIPADQVTGDLEYVIEAFDEHGNGPGRAGTPEKPLVVRTFDASSVVAVPVPVPIPTPSAAPSPEPDLGVSTAPDDERAAAGGGIVGKWWFWTLIGVAVVGAGVGVFLATRSGNVSAVDLEIVGPSPTGN